MWIQMFNNTLITTKATKDYFASKVYHPLIAIQNPLCIILKKKQFKNNLSVNISSLFLLSLLLIFNHISLQNMILDNELKND